MVIGDTSAWVDYLRGRRTRAADRLDRLLEEGLATTEVVLMELLMGARDAPHERSLRGALNGCVFVPIESADFESAAAVNRACRRAGATPRSIADCLIAAVAMRIGASVLHNDRDFTMIARHVGLSIDTP